MNKYKISYYYLASGMEGIADEFPEKIIESETEEVACYIYYLMFFESFREISFAQYMLKPDWERTWGLTVKLEEVE